MLSTGAPAVNPPVFASGEAFEVDLGHARIAGLCFGPATAEPLLALHGWLDNAASFATLAPLLPFRVIAPDLVGHGHSSHRPAGVSSPFTDHVRDLLELTEALGLGRCHLLGHSMGGAVAVLYAAAFPERVQRLGLIESLGPLTWPDAEYPQLLRRALLEQRAARQRTPPRYPEVEALIQARIEANGLDRAQAWLLLQRNLDYDGNAWTWRSDPRLRWLSPYRLSEGQVLAAITAITAPTLVLLCDPPTPYLSGPAMEQRIARLRYGRVHRLPGVHHLHLSTTAATAAALNDFYGDGASAGS
jgi:pimeloyl-ACP methyl ester carboxylesterase